MPDRMVTLLTDFGMQDAFVGIMKGVIFKISPNVIFADLSHDVPQGDIFKASLMIANWSWFPEKSVHLCVVDPGVGADRRALVCEYKKHFFVAPDNGLLEPILEKSDCRIHECVNPDFMLHPVSYTFHGRDIFAPAAAYLCQGRQVRDFGPAVSDPIRLAIPKTCESENSISGEIVYIDHFGNCFSNISAEQCRGKSVKQIEINNVFVDLVTAYADVENGSPLAIFASHHFLEIAVRNGHAADKLKINKGTRIKIHYARL